MKKCKFSMLVALKTAQEMKLIQEVYAIRNEDVENDTSHSIVVKFYPNTPYDVQEKLYKHILNHYDIHTCTLSLNMLEIGARFFYEPFSTVTML